MVPFDKVTVFNPAIFFLHICVWYEVVEIYLKCLLWNRWYYCLPIGRGKMVLLVHSLNDLNCLNYFKNILWFLWGHVFLVMWYYQTKSNFQLLIKQLIMSLFQIDFFINSYTKWISLVFVAFVFNIEDRHTDPKKKIKLWLGGIKFKRYSDSKIFLNRVIRF